jgi:hypothetical protein
MAVSPPAVTVRPVPDRAEGKLTMDIRRRRIAALAATAFLAIFGSLLATTWSPTSLALVSPAAADDEGGDDDGDDDDGDDGGQVPAGGVSTGAGGAAQDDDGAGDDDGGADDDGGDDDADDGGQAPGAAGGGDDDADDGGQVPAGGVSTGAGGAADVVSVREAATSDGSNQGIPAGALLAAGGLGALAVGAVALRRFAGRQA